MGKLLHIVRLTAIVLFVSAGLVLVACSLPFTGWKALSVQTGSMKPALNPGALVFVHSVPPSTLKQGDVITYTSKKQPGITITHRVQETAVLPNSLRETIVKGDANKLADAPIYDTQIVGKVMASVPLLGKALDFIKQPVGLALFVYTPILLLFISEIRLLVRRLTQLELDKRMAIALPKPVAVSPGMVLVPHISSEISAAPEPPKPQPVAPRKVHHKRRIVGRMGIVLLLPMVGFALAAPTFAQMHAEADITGNTIATKAAPITPPTPAPKVLLQQVDFPWDTETRHRTVDPVAITLYSTTRWKKMDISGWTIANSSGVLYTFDGTKATCHEKGRQLEVQLQRSQTLSVTGDFLVLKDTSGQTIDAISWGANTSYLNPSIQGIQAGDDIRRIHHHDTDSATDWRELP